MDDFLQHAHTDLFIYFDDFATEHELGGKTICLIDDYDALMERKLSHRGEGIYRGEHVLYLKQCDWSGKKPSQGVLVSYDHVDYRVMECAEEDGLYIFTLEANKERR